MLIEISYLHTKLIEEKKNVIEYLVKKKVSLNFEIN
jgi:hypothetical protein